MYVIRPLTSLDFKSFDMQSFANESGGSERCCQLRERANRVGKFEKWHWYDQMVGTDDVDFSSVQRSSEYAVC